MDSDRMGLNNRHTLVKVPELILLFWIAKVATTCFGEAFSDFVFFNDASWITRDRAITAGAVLIIIAYGIQIATKKYIPLVYWFAVTAVAIFGTMSSDFLIKNLGWTLWQDTLVWLVAQTVIFFAWWRTEGTLNVHSITTTRREIFYWSTVYVTFALGTAAGDYENGTLGISTFWCTVTFLGLLLIPLGAWTYAKFYVRPSNEKTYQVVAVAAFWVAYTITRPLGASFGDYLAVPAPYGDGLQLGTGPVSLWSGIVLIVIIAAVAVQYYQRKPEVQANQETVSLAAE
jgi:uncharacterized membrane-anchored protein